MKLENLNEVTEIAEGVQIETEDRLIKDIAVVGMQSANGYTYSELALREAVGLYEGRPVFLDHARDRTRPTERSARDLAGHIVGPRFENGKIRADIKYLTTESGNLLRQLVESAGKGVGMSHVVRARRSADLRLVEHIADVISVDAVINPATTTSFQESIDPEGTTIMEVTLESLRKDHPDLVKQIEDSAKASVAPAPADPNAISEAVRKAQTEAIQEERQRAADIHALCSEAGCADKADTYIREGKSKTDVQALLFKQLCESRKSPGNDGTGDEQLGEGQDPDKRFKKEYAENRVEFLQMGLSEQAYVRSRRVDEGLDVVTVGEQASK